jgi:ADP-ribose pyrophosphatase YjhB (NUDIX family)
MRATFNIDMNEDYRVAVHQHDHDGFRFCPVCGGALESRLLKEGDPARLVCVACGYVFYLDPKLAVGTVISDGDGRIVLVRRAIEPGYGKWVFPGGYVDRGEEVQRAAVREAREEAGLDVRLDRLINIYSYNGRTPVIVVYAATMIGGCLGCDEESLEARFFEPEAIPWDELAFRSTYEALRGFLGGPEGPPLHW